MVTSGYESLGTQNDLPGGLIVLMPFRRNLPRKENDRALSKKSRELTKLKTDYATLQRKYKTTLRRLQRIKQKETKKESSTPRSKTSLQIREVVLHLGDSTKRLADKALKSGKVVIKDASDFFAWTQSPTCSMGNVKFIFVSKEACESTGKELETLPHQSS